ncbi:M3 family oligoendopeptidase [Fictibacillus iocasae]|uniref:M3 family oligoendopeptidase n=1 Tax=Fictibacillus iocasae TaxID=2715437 RepID=A0ABW2NRK8_9BACL
MKQAIYPNVWNIDGLFRNGFLVHVDQIKELMNDFESSIHFFTKSNVHELLDDIGNIRIHLSQANSYLTCLLAENSKNQDAAAWRGKVTQQETRYENALSKVKRMLAHMEQSEWDSMLESEDLAEYRYILHLWRDDANHSASDEHQQLIADLSADGFHAWGHFYQTLMTRITIEVQIDGVHQNVSVGQALNLRSHPDEDVRRGAHYALENAMKEKEELFASIMNHIAGFRLNVYKQYGKDSVLAEATKENRMSEETLHTMWSVISKYKHHFSSYLNVKAEILGGSKMKAYNFWAPVLKNSPSITYDEAVELVLKHFSEFGKELEEFARQAFHASWVEAENRPNKSAAAFCAGFPLSKESRVFMTFGGTFMSVLTLVHELGHAFHNYAMKNVNGMNRYYPLSIAETASTFAEMIIFDAALKKAASKEEQLFILDEKIKRSVMNFMNIYSRFLFEQRFYEERKEGIVSSKRLVELMDQATIDAYGGSLEEFSHYSWAWTPHYYITKSPFYNFPYTFGYLFALGIYAKAKETGKEFEKDYIRLLSDSGRMSAEDLVMKHLGEDINVEEFWIKGMELCARDVEEFVKLVNQRLGR